jgi:predicted helicase
MPQDEVLSGDFTSTTISSAMPTDKRRSILDVLKNIDETKSCLVTNARCLTEGIDVPTLDAVVFVDPKSSQVVMQLADKINKELGITIVLVTHSMKDALHFGNRLLMFHGGQVIRDLNQTDKSTLQLSNLQEWFS